MKKLYGCMQGPVAICKVLLWLHWPISVTAKASGLSLGLLTFRSTGSYSEIRTHTLKCMLFLIQTKSARSAAGPSRQQPQPIQESTPRKKNTRLASTPPSSRKKPRKQPDPHSISRRRRQLALREIKYYMRTTDLLIPRLPFSRCVREVMERIMGPSSAAKFRWQKAALEALQEAAEAYLVTYFSDASLLAYHAKRITIMPRDMRLVSILRGFKWQA